MEMVSANSVRVYKLFGVWGSAVANPIQAIVEIWLPAFGLGPDPRGLAELQGLRQGFL